MSLGTSTSFGLPLIAVTTVLQGKTQKRLGTLRVLINSYLHAEALLSIFNLVAGS
jgi:hypothetical protein